MDKLTVLRSARKLLSDPKRWGKDHFAKEQEDGTTCYCALGAIRAAVGKGDVTGQYSCFPNGEAERLNIEASRELAKTIGFSGADFVPGWNDAPARTYEDVMEAFSKTCERVFAEQQAVEQEAAISC